MSMRLQVLSQMAKGLAAEAKSAPAPAEGDGGDEPLKVEDLGKSVESLKWSLCMGMCTAHCN